MVRSHTFHVGFLLHPPQYFGDPEVPYSPAGGKTGHRVVVMAVRVRVSVVVSSHLRGGGGVYGFRCVLGMSSTVVDPLPTPPRYF